MHNLEKLSTLFIWVFVVVFLADPHSLRVGEESPNYGASLMTLLINIPFIIYYRCIRRFTELVPDVITTALAQVLFQSIFIVLLAVYVDDAQIFSLEGNSIFGWLNPEIFWFNLMYNIGLCGIGGTTGAWTMVKYYPMIPL